MKKSKKQLEKELRDLARKFAESLESDSDAFRQMKKILQDELGY